MAESEAERILRAQRETAESLSRQAGFHRSILEYERQRAMFLDSMFDRQQTINQLINDMSGMDKRTRAYKDMKQALDSLLRAQEQSIDLEKQHVKQIGEQNKKLKEQSVWRRTNLEISREINKQLRIGWQYLMESDKVIKSTILNLGLSGAKADMMRTSFEESAGLAARLGGDIKDVQTIMEGFADTTGRARALMSESVEAVIAIGRGTGLGVEQATKLAAQFEFMGKDAVSTMEYVQGVVDTSERMGVNTTRVLRSISENFKKLSTFTFQRGTRAFAEMAQNAERTRVSMETALQVAEATRGLEQVIELGAQLQVMGGEFAKMDPLHWMYTVRNEPERITEMLSEMTKGIYTLRQQSDGTFERFVSPADRDRLANVARSLGITNEEMFQIAQRRHDIELMSQSLSGMGLDPDLRQLVEGMAEFDAKTGRHVIMLAGHRRDIASLTRDQLKQFQTEQKTLRERAKEAQTFNEVFQATLNELKTALLPLLRSVNSLITSIRPHMIAITEWLTSSDRLLPAWMNVALALSAAGLIWNRMLPALGRHFGDKIGGVFAGGGRTEAQTRGGRQRRRTATPRGGGARALGGGAGVGVAAMGAGAGIGLAAKGISELADAMSKLSPEQAKALQNIGMTLAITFPLAAVGIALAGKAATAGALGFLALGAAAVGVGFGINLAAKGVGQMAEGIGTLVEKSKGASWVLAQVGVGIAAINAAMATGAVVGGIGRLMGGMSTLERTLGTISAHAEGISQVGEGFRQIGVVMSGNREDFEAVARAVK